MTPKTYKFSTFQELFDRVPADKIELCMMELGKLFAMVKKPLEIGASLVGISLENETLITLDKEFEWIDDGKGEIHARVDFPDGSNVEMETR